jgi:hypothetical protein
MTPRQQEQESMNMEQIPEPAMVSRLVDRLDVLLNRKDFEFCELISGALMFAWGLWLLMPWATFASSRSFDGMALLGTFGGHLPVNPEITWGLMLAWIGGTEIGALLLDQRRVRFASAVGAGMAWTFMSVTFAISNWQGTGVIVYPGLTLVAMWAAWRIVGQRA